MSWTALSNGYNIIEHQVLTVNGNTTDVPIYPFTRSANIEVAADSSSGITIQSAQDAFETLFSRTKYGTASTAGILKVTSTLAADGDSELVAASIGAVNTLDGAVMKTKDYSFGSYDATKTQSLAILGSDGKITATQLPSYVDDVVLINWNEDASQVTLVSGQSSTAALAQTGVIYVDPARNRSYRYVPAAGEEPNVTPASYVAIVDYVLTKSEIESVLGPATKADSEHSVAASNGYMTGAQVAKLDETYEVAFYNTGSTAPTFESGKGLAFEIISTDSTT